MTDFGEVTATRHALLDGDGYTRLEALLPPQEAASVREEMLERLAEGREVGKGVIRMADIVHWGERFERLATHPRLLAVAHDLLGRDATLGAFSGRVLLPGCERGALHVDWPYWAMNPGMPVAPPLMLQVIWMMEPFTAENGGTEIAPGSQRWEGAPDPTRFAEHMVQATGNAGDAIVSHGLLWHRTACNVSAAPRVAVLINYTQLTVREMAPLGPFDDAFRERADPALSALLGFDYASALRSRAPAAR